MYDIERTRWAKLSYLGHVRALHTTRLCVAASAVAAPASLKVRLKA